MKIKTKSLIFILLLSALFLMMPLNVNALSKGEYATNHVKVTSNVITEQLWDGINLERFAMQAERLGSVASTDDGLMYNWDYNMVMASNSPAIKIASWGLGITGSSIQWGYKQGTTALIAKNYEQTHPGYMVIAAINGDFFANTTYTSSNGKFNNLPTFDPINTWVADGGLTLKKPTVAHPHHNVIGLNLDRTYTYHIGSIYDENGDPAVWGLGTPYYDTNGNYITTISLPNAGENLPTFTDTPMFTIGDVKVPAYIKNSDFSDTGVNIVLSGENINVEGFSVFKVYMDKYTRPNDGFQDKYWYGETLTNHEYDIDYTGIYIKGRAIEVEDVSTIESVQDKYCYVVTKDQNVISKVVRGTDIYCQYELTGDVWGNCNSTIGTVLPYILKGERTQYVAKADNYLNDAKPKAIVAFTENNECIFMLVGPGELSGSQNTIKGPSSIEVAELLERLNAYDAFSLDGGGSATIVIRENDGSFKTLNKTTDGTDRSIGNALLMIVEKPNLEVKEKTNTSITFYQSAPMAESTLLEASVHINGKEYPLVNGEVTVSNLTKGTNYDYYFTYKYQNEQGTYEVTSQSAKVKTLSEEDATPESVALSIEKLKDGTYKVSLSYTGNMQFISAKILDKNYELAEFTSLEQVLENVNLDDISQNGMSLYIKYSINGIEKELTLDNSQFDYFYTIETDPGTNPGSSGGGGFSCNMGVMLAGLVAFASLSFVIIRKKH